MLCCLRIDRRLHKVIVASVGFRLFHVFHVVRNLFLQWFGMFLCDILLWLHNLSWFRAIDEPRSLGKSRLRFSKDIYMFVVGI